MTESITVVRRHIVQFLPSWEDDPTRNVPRLGPKPEPCIVETLFRDNGSDRLAGYRYDYGYRFVWPNRPLDVYHVRAVSNVYTDWFGDVGWRSPEEMCRLAEDAARDKFIKWPIESWTLMPPA